MKSLVCKVIALWLVAGTLSAIVPFARSGAEWSQKQQMNR
jgi:hypothetical protein